MSDLRSRNKLIFSGFTRREIEKMERLLWESDEPVTKEHFKRIAISFSRSAARAGKPVVKWTEVESWFESKNHLRKSSPSGDSVQPGASISENNHVARCSELEKEDSPDLTKLEFEARPSEDGAWYDVVKFLSHRYLPSGEAEVLVRLIGVEDKWVPVKDAVRKRSISLQNADCQRVNVGDAVSCLKEGGVGDKHYDADVMEIQRRMHDIRGCRCLFLVRYQHDKFEERVRSRRLRRRAT